MYVSRLTIWVSRLASGQQTVLIVILMELLNSIPSSTLHLIRTPDNRFNLYADQTSYT